MPKVAPLAPPINTSNDYINNELAIGLIHTGRKKTLHRDTLAIRSTKYGGSKNTFASDVKKSVLSHLTNLKVKNKKIKLSMRSKNKNNPLSQGYKRSIDNLKALEGFVSMPMEERKRLRKLAEHDSVLDTEDIDDLSEMEPTCIRKIWDKFIITPECKLRQYWDLVILVLLGYTIMVLPVRVAFHANDDTIDPLDVVVDSLFFLDIIFCFFSAYTTMDGEVIMDPSAIIPRYLRGWFVPDVIATFPFYLINSNTVGRLSVVLRIPRLLKVLRLVRLIKLVRAYRLGKFFETLEYSPRIHQGLVRMFKLFFIVLFFGHFSACVWYFIGDMTIDESEYNYNPDSWIERTFDIDAPILDDNVSRRYLVSAYWAVTALTTVGFGDITPKTNPELIFTIIMMVIGATMFSYITATVSSVLHDFDRQASLFRGKMTSLINFMKNSQLPIELQTKLMDEMATIWKNRSTVKDVGSMRDEMPRALAFEVALEFHSDLINNSAFFSMFSHDNLEHQFVGELVSELKPSTSYEGEFVGSVGDPVDKWAILHKGSAVALSPLDSDVELMWWHEGDSFGEVGIFLTQHWPWNMRCCSDCLFYYTGARSLLSVVAHHRSVSQKLVRLAGERIFRIQKAKKNIRRQNIRRQKKHGTEKKKKTHHRLQGLIDDVRFRNLRSEHTKHLHFDEDFTDPDRKTAKGRWRWLKRRVVGTGIESKLKTFKAVTEMAIQVRKYQAALDDIRKDMNIWKQGMTIRSRDKESTKNK